ncbi:hypothetical protein SAMN02799630_01038 [Paenibacillus sp. UNCCL117]|uniref:DUF2264 domain-containing protein n=1 Tax=unclassified Paenibacillus TaxID=185978 RepID=UPI00088281FD|nr:MULTISPECIES: DUF2264 domain-containing protein [unclassified Paenibacillus]SDC63486.1 hypothetical protein SAMN04488602_10315 [Paenibacillus sp. cl123]SFW22305.1 hypothetical protein SAMN02799630_01038 [Paenibacillus sp. UNCCL117]
MNTWHLPITANPLRSREDLLAAFRQLSGPLQPYFSPGGARLELGSTGTSYSHDVAGMEGFSRVLWGLVPLLAGGGEGGWLWDIYVRGIVHGTDPGHEEYWGEAADYDQRLVEMAAFGFMLALVPDKVKNALSAPELERLAAWLDQISRRKVWDCNWLFFRVLVQVGFRRAGLPFDRELTDLTLDQLDRFYLGDGWYADGIGGHSDYYVPFAIHYYGLIYAALMGEEDPRRAELYKTRARLFAGLFVHWFDDNGAALPYGRSLAYRFSQAAFWSALVYAGVDALPLGAVKGLILRNLRWWFRQPVFHRDGVLSIGYAYPNLVMGENYNSPGSPYWAFKTFLLAALPDDHPFWEAEELPLSALELAPVSAQQAPHLLLCRDSGSPEAGTAPHLIAFNTGHPGSNEHTHTSAKYEKFAYSTFFGFSVPRAEWGLSQGAFDSMLALSEGDNQYRVKRTSVEAFLTEGLVYTKWRPWNDVEVQTWIIPGLPWHIRVHRVDTKRVLDAADGGFALGLERPGGWAAAGGADRAAADQGGNSAAATAWPTGGLKQEASSRGEGEIGAWAAQAWGLSGVRCLYGGGTSELITPHANTNLMNPRTVIPTVRTRLERGVRWLATAVCGEPLDGSAGARAGLPVRLCERPDAPYALVQGGELLVYRSPAEPEPAFRRRLE